MGTTELAAERDRRGATFQHVVCGVNASRADAETVRQAALLSGPGGKLEVFCVIDATGYGPTEQATIAAPRAEKAVEQARHNAADLGIPAQTCIVHGSSVWNSLAHAATGADLLVVGSRGGSRAGGIMLGSVATEAVHRAEMPVLVARRLPGVEFPKRILLAKRRVARLAPRRRDRRRDRSRPWVRDHPPHRRRDGCGRPSRAGRAGSDHQVPDRTGACHRHPVWLGTDGDRGVRPQGMALARDPRTPAFEHATVADAMRHGVISCPPDMPLRAVARMMAGHHVHSVVVTGRELDDAGRIRKRAWGIVTDLDLAGAGAAIDDVTAGEVAVAAVPVVTPGASLSDAARVMAEERVAHLVVVSPDSGEPIGVISTLDVAGNLGWARG